MSFIVDFLQRVNNFAKGSILLAKIPSQIQKIKFSCTCHLVSASTSNLETDLDPGLAAEQVFTAKVKSTGLEIFVEPVNLKSEFCHFWTRKKFVSTESVRRKIYTTLIVIKAHRWQKEWILRMAI